MSNPSENQGDPKIQNGNPPQGDADIKQFANHPQNDTSFNKKQNNVPKLRLRFSDTISIQRGDVVRLVIAGLVSGILIGLLVAHE